LFQTLTSASIEAHRWEFYTEKMLSGSKSGYTFPWGRLAALCLWWEPRLPFECNGSSRLATLPDTGASFNLAADGGIQVLCFQCIQRMVSDSASV